MSTTVRLRLLQIACILLVLVCIWIIRVRHNRWDGTITPRHWLVIGCTVWTAISGFTLQRRIVNRTPRTSRTSTPFTRWRAGHLLRLWTAMAVGMWALILSDFAGPPWLVRVFFVVSLLLLVAWMPGSVPANTQ